MNTNQQVKEQKTVLHLFGWSGTGKTHLLERFALANQNAVQILTPSKQGEVFNPALADLKTFAVVALDEVLMWERDSVASGVAELEQNALATGKQLILVTQGCDDLLSAGVQLATKPIVLQLRGQQDAVDLSFNGKSMHFAKPVTA